MGDDVLATIAHDLVDAIRKSVTIDWTQRESIRAKMRIKIKRLLRKHGYPPDKREAAVITVIEQAEQVCRDWVDPVPVESRAEYQKWSVAKDPSASLEERTRALEYLSKGSPENVARFIAEELHSRENIDWLSHLVIVAEELQLSDSVVRRTLADSLLSLAQFWASERSDPVLWSIIRKFAVLAHSDQFAGMLQVLESPLAATRQVVLQALQSVLVVDPLELGTLAADFRVAIKGMIEEEFKKDDRTADHLALIMNAYMALVMLNHPELEAMTTQLIGLGKRSLTHQTLMAINRLERTWTKAKLMTHCNQLPELKQMLSQG